MRARTAPKSCGRTCSRSAGGRQLGKQVTRRCHWVSQSYLRAFAADDAGERIWRFSKSAGAPELKRIEKVAVKFHLYAPNRSDGRRDDSMERKLAQLENFFGDRMWAAVCNDFPDYSWEPLRKMVALLAAVTWLRTPHQFEQWKSVHRHLVDFYSGFERLPDKVGMNGQRFKLDHASWPAFRDATEDGMKVAWHGWLGNAAEIATALMKMRWAVVFSETPVFITSDNPVLVGDTINPHRGLKHSEMMVTFPLSPTRMLVMDNRHHEPDAQFYPLRHHPASSNMLIWRNALEHMFSPRHPDEVCAEFVADAEAMGIDTHASGADSGPWN